MNPKRYRTLFANLITDSPHFPRHGPAVRVAENHAFGPCRNRLANRLERIFGIGLVSIKKMLGIIKHSPILRSHVGYGIADEVKIFRERNTQCVGDVERPGLPKE